MKDFFKKIKNPYLKFFVGLMALGLGVAFLPFIMGGWLIAVSHKKIQNQKLKFATLGAIGLLSLGIGVPWVQGFFAGSSSSSTPPGQTQAEATPPTDQATAQSEVPTAETSSNTEPAPTPPQVELFTVSRVVDGDTIEAVVNGKAEKIRLIGIDTPETVDPRKPVQCFGEEASKKTKELLEGKKVKLEADSTQDERDKYDRLLRFVFLEDGTNFNKLLISEGYAHEYTYESNPYKYQAEFKDAERQAREGNKGLWSSTTCSGTTTATTPSPAQSTAQPVPAPTETKQDTSAGVVKMSTSRICHAPGTTYYSRTKNFTPYDTLDECLAAGGRLPER